MTDVIHARHDYRRDRATGDFVAVHPCGTPYERGVTREPRSSNWNEATLSWLPALVVNCPGCLAAVERHAALCAVVSR